MLYFFLYIFLIFNKLLLKIKNTLWKGKIFTKKTAPFLFTCRRFWLNINVIPVCVRLRFSSPDFPHKRTKDSYLQLFDIYPLAKEYPHPLSHPSSPSSAILSLYLLLLPSLLLIIFLILSLSLSLILLFPSCSSSYLSVSFLLQLFLSILQFLLSILLRFLLSYSSFYLIFILSYSSFSILKLLLSIIYLLISILQLLLSIIYLIISIL